MAWCYLVFIFLQFWVYSWSIFRQTQNDLQYEYPLMYKQVVNFTALQYNVNSLHNKMLAYYHHVRSLSYISDWLAFCINLYSYNCEIKSTHLDFCFTQVQARDLQGLTWGCLPPMSSFPFFPKSYYNLSPFAAFFSPSHPPANPHLFDTFSSCLSVAASTWENYAPIIWWGTYKDFAGDTSFYPLSLSQHYLPLSSFLPLSRPPHNLHEKTMAELYRARHQGSQVAHCPNA